jgi:hypothetical protein
MSVRVQLQFVKPTMRLAAPVCDAQGMPVAGAGTLLGQSVVRALRRLAVQSVLVEEADGVARWETSRALAEEVGEVEHRFARVERSEALDALREAIRRHLTARAARLAAAGEGTPGSGSEE